MVRMGANRLGICLFALLALSIPTIAMSAGPSATNSNDDLTVKYGCSCHNNAAPSDRAIVMITGVPLVYEPSQVYQYTVTVADSLALSGGDGNTKAGFLLSSDSVGSFSWDGDQEIRDADGRPGDVSHPQADSDGVWHLSWTAPSEDVGPVQFWLAGNSVDGGGIPDDMDYWNLLSFTISAPGTVTTTESPSTLETRTISVGTYDALFVIEASEEQLEQERQDALAAKVFSQGNLFYWTSLVALLVGAVVQREILERRFDGGPDHLASELAYPQGLRRAFVSIVSLYFGVRWSASGQSMTFQGVDFSDFAIGTTFLISAWAAYGVYRTVISARKEPKIMDQL